jgi:hypothetical protein
VRRGVFQHAWRALGFKGRLDEGIEQFLEAVRLGPDNPYAHFNLAVAGNSPAAAVTII